MSGPAPAGPGVVAKASLTTGRLIHKPFHVPTRMTDSAELVGKVGTGLAVGTTQMITGSLRALQPRIGASALQRFQDKVDNAAVHSMTIAERNTNVFWRPMSDGFDNIGMAVAGPFAYHYARKGGAAHPSNPNLLNALVHSKGYPGAAEMDSVPLPATPGDAGASQQSAPAQEPAPSAAPDAGGAPPADAAAAAAAAAG